MIIVKNVQRCLEISEYFLDEKKMNDMGEVDWSEYYCNRSLAERTDGVVTRTGE